MTGPEHYREGESYLHASEKMMRTATEHTVVQAAASATAAAAIAQAHFVAAQSQVMRS